MLTTTALTMTTTTEPITFTPLHMCAGNKFIAPPNSVILGYAPPPPQNEPLKISWYEFMFYLHMHAGLGNATASYEVDTTRPHTLSDTPPPQERGDNSDV